MKLIALLQHRRARIALRVLPPALLAIGVAYRAKFAPVPVMAYEVKPTPITAEVMGTGTLEARTKTTLSARLQERLTEVLVDQNDSVKAGQLLARLDDGELTRQVEIATAALAAARATAQRVAVDEARAQAVEKRTRLDHKRLSELVANGIASSADLDKATEQLQVAEADLKRAHAAIVEAERQVVTAEKSLAFQKERLNYARILSPYDGLVVRRDRDPGGVVVPGSSILQLISTNEFWVSAWVDETASAAILPGQPARVVFRSEPTKTYPGVVARLAREADRETREFLVDVRVTQLPPNWILGQRAEVFVETAHKAGALTVPQPYLHWLEGNAGVFVNDHGKARWRAVTMGLHGRETVEITHGLTPGENVVKLAQAKRRNLLDGQRIARP